MLATRSTPPTRKLIIAAVSESIERGLAFAGVIDPLAGSIVRRAGNGAVVLCGHIGQDEETGADLYDSVGVVVWDEPADGALAPDLWDDAAAVAVSYLADDYARKNGLTLIGPAMGVNPSAILARVWGGLIQRGPIDGTVQYHASRAPAPSPAP